MAQKHLKDVFVTGAPVTVRALDPSTGNEDEFEVWMSKLNSTAQDQVIAKARTAEVRRKQLVKEEYGESLDSQVDLAYDDLVEALLVFARQDLQRQAYEEVLSNPDEGSDWTGEGLDLLGISNAIEARLGEIIEHNADPDNDEDQIDSQQDKELKRLNKLHGQFMVEVHELQDKLTERERTKLKAYNRNELQERLRGKLIEVEVKSVWIDAYRMNAVYQSVRYMDNKKRKYFDSVDQVEQLPDYVFEQLWTAYDDIALGADDVKK